MKRMIGALARRGPDGEGVELWPTAVLGRMLPRRAPWWRDRRRFRCRGRGGALPDSVTHSEVLYNFVKPPVHGWALRQHGDRTTAFAYAGIAPASR